MEGLKHTVCTGAFTSICWMIILTFYHIYNITELNSTGQLSFPPNRCVPKSGSNSTDVLRATLLGSSGATYSHLFLVPVPGIWGGVFSVMGVIEGGASQTHRTFCYSSKKCTSHQYHRVDGHYIPSSTKKAHRS